MLLNLYLGTTLFSWIAVTLKGKAIENRLKREGYVVRKKKTSLIEEIVKWLTAILKMSIPVLNIVAALNALFSNEEKVYEYVKKDYLCKGLIYKRSCPNDVLQEEDKAEREKAATEEVTERLTKSYDKMTVEEKRAYLQQQLDRLQDLSRASEYQSENRSSDGVSRSRRL